MNLDLDRLSLLRDRSLLFLRLGGVRDLVLRLGGERLGDLLGDRLLGGVRERLLGGVRERDRRPRDRDLLEDRLGERDLRRRERDRDLVR